MSEQMKRFVAAKAVIRNGEGRYLLLREALYDEGTNLGKWGVPGGRVEGEETLSDALLREAQEEAGLSVRQGKLIGVVENMPVIKGEKVHIVRLFYLCEPTTREVQLSSEHDAYEWVSVEELKNFDIMPGEREIIEAL